MYAVFLLYAVLTMHYGITCCWWWVGGVNCLQMLSIL